jgi:hypothetical protein
MHPRYEDPITGKFYELGEERSAEEVMETMFSVKVELISTIHLNPGQIVEIEGEEYQIVWDGLEDQWILRPSS